MISFNDNTKVSDPAAPSFTGFCLKVIRLRELRVLLFRVVSQKLAVSWGTACPTYFRAVKKFTDSYKYFYGFYSMGNYLTKAEASTSPVCQVCGILQGISFVARIKSFS
jgi:hypothetical protein